MPGVKSIAMGYMRAHKRLRTAYSKAYALHPDKVLDDGTAEEIWIELFEALNWLDALRLSPERAARMEPELADALMFVPGRVHHAFADAIEFRRDVLLFLRPTMPGKSGPSGPLPSPTGAGVRPRSSRAIGARARARGRGQARPRTTTASQAGR